MLRHNFKQITALPIEKAGLSFSIGYFFSSAAQKVCHYDALGVHPNASLEDIKRAYYHKGKNYPYIFTLLFSKALSSRHKRRPEKRGFT